MSGPATVEGTRPAVSEGGVGRGRHSARAAGASWTPAGGRPSSAPGEPRSLRAPRRGALCRPWTPTVRGPQAEAAEAAAAVTCRQLLRRLYPDTNSRAHSSGPETGVTTSHAVGDFPWCQSRRIPHHS